MVEKLHQNHRLLAALHQEVSLAAAGPVAEPVDIRGVAAAAVFLFFLAYSRRRLAYYGMSFLAVECMLNAFYDLRTLIAISASHAGTISDASMLSRETLGVIPPLGWAIGLSGVSLLITYILVRRLIR